MSSNSWVLITGANRATGLGYKTAKQLVNDGESVIIGARTQASGAPFRLPLSPFIALAAPHMITGDGKGHGPCLQGKLRNAALGDMGIAWKASDPIAAL